MKQSPKAPIKPRNYTLMGYLWQGIFISVADAESLRSFGSWPALPLYARIDALAEFSKGRSVSAVSS